MLLRSHSVDICIQGTTTYIPYYLTLQPPSKKKRGKKVAESPILLCVRASDTEGRCLTPTIVFSILLQPIISVPYTLHTEKKGNLKPIPQVITVTAGCQKKYRILY